MHRSLIYLTATAGLVSAGGSAVCSSNPYKLFQPFSTYAPAQSFCSSRFPVAPVTTTSTVVAYVTATATTTQTALSTQVIQSTVVSTETDSVTLDVTATQTTNPIVFSTETDYVTVTVTVTGGVQAQAKRSDVPTALLAKWPPRISTTAGLEKRELEARAQKTTSTSKTTLKTTTSSCTSKKTTSTTSKTTSCTTSKTTTSSGQGAMWGALAAQASAILSTGCSCIETPRTVTATQTTTSTATVTNINTVTNVATTTSLASSTATTSATVTLTFTETQTIPVTIGTTTSATVTATATVAPSCLGGSNSNSNGVYHCSYNVLCSMQGSYGSFGSDTPYNQANGATTLRDCLVGCNNDNFCGAVNFDHISNTCTFIEFPGSSLQYANTAAYTAVASANVDFAYITGNCSG
ncbi:hypothetical protein LTR95_005127 [Oleoguttula sp. CCFEE 5521]